MRTSKLEIQLKRHIEDMKVREQELRRVEDEACAERNALIQNRQRLEGLLKTSHELTAKPKKKSRKEVRQPYSEEIPLATTREHELSEAAEKAPLPKFKQTKENPLPWDDPRPKHTLD